MDGAGGGEEGKKYSSQRRVDRAELSVARGEEPFSSLLLAAGVRIDSSRGLSAFLLVKSFFSPSARPSLHRLTAGAISPPLLWKRRDGAHKDTRTGKGGRANTAGVCVGGSQQNHRAAAGLALGRANSSAAVLGWGDSGWLLAKLVLAAHCDHRPFHLSDFQGFSRTSLTRK